MFAEVGAGAETFPAVRALEGFHARVDALMDGEVRALGEGLPTGQAFKGPLSGVDPLMDDQVGFGNKGLATLGALVRLLLLVVLVAGQARGNHFEAPPTVREFVKIVFLMFNQVGSLPEVPPARQVGVFSFVELLVIPGTVQQFLALPRGRARFLPVWQATCFLPLGSVPPLQDVILLPEVGNFVLQSPPSQGPVENLIKTFGMGHLLIYA